MKGEYIIGRAGAGQTINNRHGDLVCTCAVVMLQQCPLYLQCRNLQGIPRCAVLCVLMAHICVLMSHRPVLCRRQTRWRILTSYP